MRVHKNGGLHRMESKQKLGSSERSFVQCALMATEPGVLTNNVDDIVVANEITNGGAI